MHSIRTQGSPQEGVRGQYTTGLCYTQEGGSHIMMNREQVEALFGMKQLPSNMEYVGQYTPQSGLFAGQTMPLFEMREVKITLLYQPPEFEVFDEALLEATMDELEYCLRKSTMRLREHPSEAGEERVQKILQEFKRRGGGVPPHNVTVEEALRLSTHCDYAEGGLAYKIAQAYRNAHSSNMSGFEYGACFHAGVVEGVRRERTRRRRRQGGQGA